jgi:hypothetical protein
MIWRDYLARIGTLGDREMTIFSLPGSLASLFAMDPSGEATGAKSPLSRAWYGTTIEEFLRTEPERVLGILALNGEFALLPTQRDAWMVQMVVLASSLNGLTGSLLLEFSIPRMGRRIGCLRRGIQSW